MACLGGELKILGRGRFPMDHMRRFEYNEVKLFDRRLNTCMRFFVSGWLLALMFFAGSVTWAATANNVSAADAWKLVESNKDVFLLDVRTPQEYQQVRLEGASLIPIDQVVRRMNEIPRDRPILVYCAVGSRSAQVANYLARQNYGPVYNMYGGIWSWQSRGLPVLSGPP